jgi:hypothetical protein
MLDEVHERGQINGPPFWTRKDGQWQYNGSFESLPPLDWPVYVSHIEALAFTRWRGCRLPTEAEWHRAFESAPAPQTGATTLILSHGIRHQFLGVIANSFSWRATAGMDERAVQGFPGFKPFPHYLGYSAVL